MSSTKPEHANISTSASSNPLDYVPAEMPFDVPYGPPLSLARTRPLLPPPWQRPSAGTGR